MKSYEIVYNENFVGHSQLLRSRHAKIRARDGHVENNIQMVNLGILFSSKYAMYFLFILYHGRVVIF